MSENDGIAPQSSEEPSGPPRLEYYEGIIDRGLSNTEAVALALQEIHQQKLYRQGYRSFKTYLQQRWHMSRARGYQLLDFAKLKQLSATEDKVRPANERQARRLRADGKPRRPKDDDPIAEAMEYVFDACGSLPPSERAEFIYWIWVMLEELEKDLDPSEKAKLQQNFRTNPSHGAMPPLATTA